MGIKSKFISKEGAAAGTNSYYSNCSTPRVGFLEAASKLSLYESNPAHSPAKLKLLHLKKQSSLKENKGESQQETYKHDVFDLGYTLLVAATGGLEILGDSFFHSIERGRGCCVLHQGHGRGKLRLKHLLSHFSKEFLDFLCHCLRFETPKRSSVHELLRHQWLTTKPISGP